MRTALLATLGLLSLTTVVGCGPGLSHRVKAQSPQSPDVFTTMDAELASTIGTTSVTSAEPMPLPESRLSLAQWDADDDVPAQKAAQTWGVPQLLAMPPLDLEPSPYEPKTDPASYP
jgi:hypothetical protein